MGWAVGEVASCNRWEGGREGGRETSKVARLSPTRMQLLGFPESRRSHRKGIPLYHRVLAGPEDKGRLEVGI